MLRSALHAITENLESPAIIALIAILVLIVALIGEVVAEYFATRFRRKLDMPKILTRLAEADSLDAKREIIGEYRFQKNQEKTFARAFAIPEGISETDRRNIAVQLLMDEDIRTDKVLFITKIISRIGPMLGLMGTLIPLGPGLQALGDGDPKALSGAMLLAFDTTVAGLLSAAVAFIIYEIRKTWYKSDLNALETVLDEITGEEPEGGEAWKAAPELSL
jgi:biopolymer transport protein ExbB/TolQ